MSDASEERSSSAGEEFPVEEPAEGDEPRETADAEAGTAAEAGATGEAGTTGDGETLEQLIERDFEKLVAERDEYLDSLRRLQADFDNYRKRAVRQQTELLERASENLLVELLPVLDALDLADAHSSSHNSGSDGNGEDDASALTQIAMLLRGTLEREGLQRIDAVGVPFDPTIHDAVAHEPAAEDDEEKGSVSEVMRAGYRLKGRVVRPAMVKVKG
jgi:molecular chaperone GrpE